MRLKRSLRNGLGWLLAMILIISGQLRKARGRSFQENVITPVAFHNPPARLFHSIIRWLADNSYAFISTDQLIKIINKEIPCPRGAVWISLDDGWKDNLDNVIPFVKRYDIPITIFVTTGAVESGTFWWRVVEQSGGHPGTEVLKQLPDDARRQVIASLDESASHWKREAMTAADIREIAALPQLTIGAHTVTHPILPKCTVQQIEEELLNSKKQVEVWTGKPVMAFAYPNGSYDGREREYLERCGYALAATTESRPGTPESDRYLFPRNVVMDDGSLAENLCHALGIWEPVVKRLK